MSLFDFDGATFSPDRKYRYVLWRTWDEGKPPVMFIGLNPSTANEDEPDPTIKRVISFAKSMNAGSVYMLNLYGFVSSDPIHLLKQPDPQGEQDRYLKEYGEKASRIVFAWGAFKGIDSRAKEVIKMFPQAEALILNKNGTPRHPLYVPGNIEPVKFIAA